MDELVGELPRTGAFAGATKVRFQVLIAACSVALITYVHRVGFAVGTPSLRRDLGLNDEQIGYLISAFFWTYGGFQILGGWLGDRLGTRHLLTLIVFGWSLATGAVALVVYVPGGLTNQLIFLLVLRALFGTLQAGGFPLLSRMNADWMPVTMRGTSQGLIWMSTRLGGALIPLALGWMFMAMGNWQTPFWVIAAIGFLWCAIFWPWFRDLPEEMPSVNAQERKLIASGRGPRVSGRHVVPWRRILTTRSALALCLAYGFGGFSTNFFVGMLPSYLKNQRHLSDATTQLLTSLPLAAGVVACLCGGMLSDWFIRVTGNRRWGRCLNGSISMFVAATAILSTIWVDNVVIVAALLTITFASNDLAMGPAWAACADIGERSAGTLGGAMNMMANIGGAVSALVAGALFQRRHPEWVFMIFAASYVLAALSWMCVDAGKSLAEKEPIAAED
jgi:sugar phosphate permease